MLIFENFIFGGFTEILIKDKDVKILSLEKEIICRLKLHFSVVFSINTWIKFMCRYHGWLDGPVEHHLTPSPNKLTFNKKCTELPQKRKERLYQVLPFQAVLESKEKQSEESTSTDKLSKDMKRISPHLHIRIGPLSVHTKEYSLAM